MNWILSKLFPVKRTPYSDFAYRRKRIEKIFYELVGRTYGEYPHPRLN